MKESWRGGWRKKQQKNFSASLNMCREEKNSLPFLRILFISKWICPAAKGKGAPWTTSSGGTYWLSIGARKILCLLKFLLCSCFLQGCLVSISYSNLTSPCIHLWALQRSLRTAPAVCFAVWNHRGMNVFYCLTSVCCCQRGAVPHRPDPLCKITKTQHPNVGGTSHSVSSPGCLAGLNNPQVCGVYLDTLSWLAQWTRDRLGWVPHGSVW